MALQEERHKEAIEYAVKILTGASYRKYIKKIYLFGSCAKRQNKYTSDVDLLVECDETLTPETARRMRVAVMPDELDMPEIDLKFVKGTAWRAREDRFSKNLAREGILIWKK